MWRPFDIRSSSVLRMGRTSSFIYTFFRLTFRRSVRKLRQGQKEGGTAALPRLEPQLAAVAFNQFAADVEAQPGSANPPGDRIVRAHETPKDLSLLPGGNADAAILHAQDNRPCRLFCSQCENNRATLRAVL